MGSSPTSSAFIFMEEELKYPVRINKYLAHQKICARREADELILQKKVKINGRVAVLGDKVQQNDKVTVDNSKKKLFYLAFNKPKGIITHSPQNGEKEIKDILNLTEDISNKLFFTNINPKLALEILLMEV